MAENTEINERYVLVKAIASNGILNFDTPKLNYRAGIAGCRSGEINEIKKSRTVVANGSSRTLLFNSPADSVTSKSTTNTQRLEALLSTERELQTEEEEREMLGNYSDMDCNSTLVVQDNDTNALPMQSVGRYEFPAIYNDNNKSIDEIDDSFETLHNSSLLPRQCKCFICRDGDLTLSQPNPEDLDTENNWVPWCPFYSFLFPEEEKPLSYDATYWADEYADRLYGISEETQRARRRRPRKVHKPGKLRTSERVREATERRLMFKSDTDALGSSSKTVQQCTTNDCIVLQTVLLKRKRSNTI